MEKSSKNKKVLIGCVCGLLAVALVVLLAVFAGNNPRGDKPNPSDVQLGSGPSTSATTGPDATKPSESTEPPTAPTTVPPTTEPVPPTTEPVPTSEPAVTTEPVPPTTEPVPPTTEPVPPTTAPVETTTPTDPSQGTEPTTAPTFPPDPTPGTNTDIGDVTPATITAEIWDSWTDDQKYAFNHSFDWDALTPEENFNLEIQTIYGGYDDGLEGLWFCSEEHKAQFYEEKAKGCYYCGGTDCPSFYARGSNGFTHTDPTQCPVYNVKNDPTVYCQECGNPKLGQAKVGDFCCSRTISKDLPCDNCGEMIYAEKCHNCVKRPDEERYDHQN